MPRSNHRVDTSNELVLQRWAGGFMLSKPNKISAQMNTTVATLGDVMNQPFAVYIYSLDHHFQSANNRVSYDDFSAGEVLNKHICEVFPNEGDKLVTNNVSVLNAGRTKIFQQKLILSDGIAREHLSIKAPLYNKDGKLGGLLGLSIRLEEANMISHLQAVAQLGMLNSPRQCLKQNVPSVPPVFSERERECLYYLSTARSAKEIAAKMSLSYRTVEHYIEKIKNKASCYSRTDLIDYAMSLFQ